MGVKVVNGRDVKKHINCLEFIQHFGDVIRLYSSLAAAGRRRGTCPFLSLGSGKENQISKFKNQNYSVNIKYLSLLG